MAAQLIKQGNIFGRIGTGLGKGLAEQLPKEIERNRLASGLQAFEQDYQNLTPMQQVARASAIPGITPQTIQSLTDLAKIQNQGNAYRNRLGRPQGAPQPQGQEPQASADLTPVQNKQFLENVARGKFAMPQGMGQIPGAQGQQPKGQPQQIERIPTENTFNPSAKPVPPWTPERRDDKVDYYITRGHLPEEAKQLAQDDEARERGIAPVIEARQRKEREDIVNARNEFDRQLDLKLQKEGKEQRKDLTGEMKSNLERQMQKALRLNPGLSIEDAANAYSDKALATAKAKNNLETLAATTGIEALGKKKEINNKLDDYSDAFKDSGNSEEYYHMLKRDMGLSAEGAATKAFPMSRQPQDYVKNYRPQQFKQTKYGEIPDPVRMEANARKAANDIGKLIGENDSVLTIGRELRKKDPYFDQESFYNEMRLIKDEIGLSQRQKSELPERNTDWLPTWGDFLILPWGNTR